MMTRRIGNSCAAALLVLAGLAFAGEKHKTLREPARGVVAGTVFRDTGFAFPGAKVTLAATPAPGDSGKPFKEKTTSDQRGEFAFRVAPVEMHYKVSVEAKGYQPQEKMVEIRGEERVEATFSLQKESK